MPLTRNEWLEMWASITAIELNNRDMKTMYRFLGPMQRTQIRDITKGNELEINKIKHQIESVIGQME